MIQDAVIVHVSAVNGVATVSLAQTLNIKGYAVAVLHLSGYLKGWKSKIDSLYLCSDVCRECYVNDALLPVVCPLSSLNGSNPVVANVQNPVWLKTSRQYVNTIEVYITNEKGDRRSFPDSLLKCSLVFVPLKQ